MILNFFFNLQAKRFMKHFLYVKEIDHGKKKTSSNSPQPHSTP